MAGQLSPVLAEGLVRLGACMPFEQAAAMLAYFTQTTVSASSARRTSQAAGRAMVAVLDKAAEQVTPVVEQPHQGAQRLYAGVDGAFVPLVGGAWAEVKTLSIGEVEPVRLSDPEHGVQTTNLTYLSRLAEVDSFIKVAPLEMRRRALPAAQRVSGLSDGALWIQRFFDSCCPQAVRILDFAHAAGYLYQAGEAFFRDRPEALPAWFATWRAELKAGSARRVVAELHRLSLEAYDRNLSQTLQTAIADAHDYLKSRLSMIAYATFHELGHPIGSGASESANKLVVERRLKGPGMHWQPDNLNPMLALTNAAANHRWEELWPASVAHRRSARYQHLLARHAPPQPLPPQPLPPPSKPAYKPSKDHPWKQQPIGRQCRRSSA